MSVKSDVQLVVEAEVIRNETVAGANTRGRIAQMIEDLVDSKFSFIDITVLAGTNNYTGTVSSAIGAYTLGQLFKVQITNINTGACTININGIGVATLVDSKGNALTAGGFSGIMIIGYDGSKFQIIGGSGSSSGSSWDPSTYPSAGPITGPEILGASQTSLIVGLTANQLATFMESYSNNDQTGDYTLQLSDVFPKPMLLRMNSGSAQNLTIPKDATTNFPTFMPIPIIRIGATAFTFVADSGVTLNISNGTILDGGRFIIMWAYKTAANIWTISNGLPAVASPIGKHDYPVPAAAFWPRNTNGCTSLAKSEIATSLVNIQELAFDQSTQQYAQAIITLPRNWDNGTVKVKFYWRAASGSGDVLWNASLGAYSDGDALTNTLGTAQQILDTLISTTVLQISAFTPAITVGNTPIDGDLLCLQVSRVAADGTDTLNASALLSMVVITVNTDAATAE